MVSDVGARSSGQETARPAARLRRSLRHVVRLVGRPVLIASFAAPVLVAGSLVPRAVRAQPPVAVTVVNFDDLKTVPPGGATPVLITDQYGGDPTYLVIRRASAYDYGDSSPGFARSEPNAIVFCDPIEGCGTEGDLRFQQPYGWVRLWFGAWGAHNDRTVTANASDDRGNVLSSNSVTIPASPESTAVNFPLDLAAGGSGQISRVAVTVSDGSLEGVVLDDVTYAPQPPPDLTIDSIYGTLDGATVTLSVAVRNAGPGPSGQTTVRVTGAGQTQDVPVAGLTAGDSITVQATVDVSQAAPGSTVDFQANVDPDGTTGDIDDTNNGAVAQVAVPLPSEQPAPSPSESAPASSQAVESPGPTAASTSPRSPSGDDTTNAILGLVVISAAAGAGWILWRHFHRDDPGPAVQLTYTTRIAGENVVVEAKDGDVSVHISDDDPPKTCKPAPSGRLGGPECWYAKRELTVAPAGGKVKDVSLIATPQGGPARRYQLPAADLAKLTSAKDGPAKDLARIKETLAEALADEAVRLIRIQTGTWTVETNATVEFLDVPATVTVSHCVRSPDGSGAFKKVRDLSSKSTVTRTRRLDRVTVGPDHRGAKAQLQESAAKALDQLIKS